jgi:hypothetical protein
MIFGLLLVSCEQKQGADNVDTNASQEQQDPIRNSQTYKSYVTAHADYQSCIDQRSKLTDQLIANQITREEFDETIKKNTRTCQLKKQLVNLYWRVLESEYDNITSDYNLMPQEQN